MRGICTIVTLAYLTVSGLANAQIVHNGGFEADDAGWALSGNVGAGGGGVVGANEGLVAVQFNAGESVPNGVVSQAIATEPGEQYTVEFDYGVYGGVVRNQSLRVEALGAALLGSLTVNGQSAIPTSWQRHSLVFTADSATTLLAFTDVSLPATTFSVDGALDDVVVTGPAASGPPLLVVQVEYTAPSVVSGPVSFGLSGLPDIFVATFALPGYTTANNVVAGLADVDTATLRFGDGLWTTDLTSFSLATDGTGEVTTLSYATGPLTTATAVAGVILNSSFSATIEGIDIASSQAFEYDYAGSSQTLALLPGTAAVPALGPTALWLLGAVLCISGLALARRRRRHLV